MNQPMRWFSGTGLSGGQYSVYRVLLGLYLCVHFLHLLPYGGEVFSSAGVLPDSKLSPHARLFPNFLALFDSPIVVQGALLLGAAISICIALGVRDRIAALVLWYLWACLFGRNPLIANPGLPYVGLLLVVHALLPSAPYGSLAARGRPDPRGNWMLDRGLLGVVWILLAVGYTYSGLAKLGSPSWLDGSATQHLLQNPLARDSFLRTWLLELPGGMLRLATWGALGAEILFAPLALFRRTRVIAWLSMVVMHLGIVFLVDFADLTLGMLLVHLFVFDPRWVPSKGGASEPEELFYDGECGLCHGAVRFVLSEDREARIRLAALQGERFQEVVPAEEQKDLPDSILLRNSDGILLAKTAAVRHLLARLGGLWRVAGWGLALIPRPLRDLAYDGIAKIRKRIFAQPTGLCPMVPPDLGRRFL